MHKQNINNTLRTLPPGRFERKSKQEKASIIHDMLKRAHNQLMRTTAFKDLDEQEEHTNYDFLEKWV